MLPTRPGPFQSLPRRALREAWWLYALAGIAVGLYAVGLDVRLRCRLHEGCEWSRDRYFSLDSIGGLPRLFVTCLFVVLAVLAWRASRRTTGRASTWWAAVAVTGAGLALLKLVSAHSAAKADAYVATLVVGVALSVVVLGALWRAARRWGVDAGPSVVVALAVYAFAAVGLDAVTGAVAAMHGTTGVVADSLATFVEEFGEALGALFALAIVWWCQPPPPRGDQVVRQQ
jgi:ribosomal protein L35AE/L33A